MPPQPGHHGRPARGPRPHRRADRPPGRRGRHRLRRHRDEPALRVQGVHRRRARRSTPTRANVLGVLSLIVWSLMLVVTLKYLVFVMRADNEGEGGILALLALTPERMRGRGRSIGVVALLVIAGASLLYGDGMITPAISVLSAVEGLGAEAPALKAYVVPITCVILLGLFAHPEQRDRQRRPPLRSGDGRLVPRARRARRVPRCRRTPPCSRRSTRATPSRSSRSTSSAASRCSAPSSSTITGGEALYADMGHFGARPIRLAWLGLVFPSLLLAYFGMGALVLADPGGGDESVLRDGPARTGDVGARSASRRPRRSSRRRRSSAARSRSRNQAVQLGFFPRVTIKHTSGEAEGQIYVPEINWLLAAACIALVGWAAELLEARGRLRHRGHRHDGHHVGRVLRRDAHDVELAALARRCRCSSFFLAFDIPFFVANATKFFHGGYVPILIGAVFFTVMVVWRRGRRMLADALAEANHAGRRVPRRVRHRRGAGEGKAARIQCRIEGTGVVMSSHAEGVPAVFVHHVERLRCSTRSIVILTIVTARVPVRRSRRSARRSRRSAAASIASSARTASWRPRRPDAAPRGEACRARREHRRRHVLPRSRDDARRSRRADGRGRGEPLRVPHAQLPPRDHRTSSCRPSQVIEIGTQIDL